MRNNVDRRHLLIAATVTAILCLVSLAFLVHRTNSAVSRDYLPRHTDTLSFSVPPVDSVAMALGNTMRYQLTSEEGAEEFAKLLPSGGHLVYVRDQSEDAQDEISPKVYTVTLFHQLKCLGIIREQLLNTSTNGTSTMTRHCLNYIRQTILCRPNTRLESAKSNTGLASRNYDTVCKDWTALYTEAERNQLAFSMWKEEHSDA